MNNFSTQAFEKSGYIEYPNSIEKILFKSCDRFFQKRIKDIVGNISYFIDVYWYDNTKYDVKYGSIGVDFEVSFYDNDETCIRIAMSGSGFETIEQVEDRFKRLYDVNHFAINPHNL